MLPLPQAHCPLLVRADPQPRQPHPRIAVAAPERGRPCAQYRAVGGAGIEQCAVGGGRGLDDLQALLNPPGYQARLLFPADDAQPLQAYAPGAQPLLLVVPDGTWRKARKLLHLNPLLAALPRVTLAEAAVSRYRLRKAPGPGRCRRWRRLCRRCKCWRRRCRLNRCSSRLMH